MTLTKKTQIRTQTRRVGLHIASHLSYWVAFLRQQGNCSLGDRPAFLLLRALSAAVTIASEWLEEQGEIINLGDRQVQDWPFRSNRQVSYPFSHLNGSL